jgi:hypothetical protein
MKNLIISCAVLFTASMFASCDNAPNAQHCYEITATIYQSVNEVPSQVTTQYVWGTKAELREAMNDINERLQATGQTIYKVEYKRTNKSESDCH